MMFAQDPKRGLSATRHLGSLALLTTVLSVASAQAPSGLTGEQYRAMTGAIDAAVQSRAKDPTQSLAQIDRARDLLGSSFPEAKKSVLIVGVRDALQNARIAVGRSQADLEAQAAHARGLLRKVMHDATLEALGRQESHAVRQVGVLADDFGLRGEQRAAIVTAARQGAVDEVRLRFEQATGEKISASLNRANTADRAGAYVEAARATGWFNVIQDSPRVKNLTMTNFVQALGALTSGDTAAFKNQLGPLQGQVTAFRHDVNVALKQVTAKVAPAPAQPSPTPTPAPAAPQATRTTPAPGTPQPAAPSNSPAVPAVTLDTLHAPLSRALVASSHGDNDTARRELTDAAHLGATLPPVVRFTPEVQDLLANVDRTRDLGALRAADIRAVLGQLSNVERTQRERGTSAWEAVSASVNGVLGGPLRAVLFLVLGVLSLYPLYLLNLAFGGRNPYWRAIGAALTLLLLPVMLEGVASLGALLEGLTGVAALGALMNVSVLQHPMGVLAWAFLAATGIGLSTWGFRGICMQFGLLGRAQDTQVQQPAVEWDEEI